MRSGMFVPLRSPAMLVAGANRPTAVVDLLFFVTGIL